MILAFGKQHFGQLLRKAVRVCEHGGDAPLLENERRKRRGPDLGMLHTKRQLCFCQGLLFSPPVVRSSAGKEEGSGVGSYMT